MIATSALTSTLCAVLTHAVLTGRLILPWGGMWREHARLASVAAGRPGLLGPTTGSRHWRGAAPRTGEGQWRRGADPHYSQPVAPPSTRKADQCEVPASLPAGRGSHTWAPSSRACCRAPTTAVPAPLSPIIGATGRGRSLNEGKRPHRQGPPPAPTALRRSG